MPATLSTGTINELLYEADKTDQIHNVVEKNVLQNECKIKFDEQLVSGIKCIISALVVYSVWIEHRPETRHNLSIFSTLNVTIKTNYYSDLSFYFVCSMLLEKEKTKI